MPRCVIPGCKRRHSSTHFFPRDPVRRLQWVDFVRSIDPDFSPPGQYSCICGAHFETRCYNFNFWIDKAENKFGCKNPRKTLSEDAVPTIVGNEMIASISGVSNMIQSVPSLATSTLNGNTSSVETHAKSLPVTSTVKNDAKSTFAGPSYTVVKNNTGQKVCIFRQLAKKPAASVMISRPPIISQPITIAKSATTTTSSSQATPVMKISTPTSSQSQQVVMLQDGAPVKMFKTNSMMGNLNFNGRPSPKQTIFTRRSVSSTSTVQTTKSTLHYWPTTEKPSSITGKKLFTVDELDKLPKYDFINKFTSRVKIMDSNNFAMRCQLIKSCPFIVSCPSELDCQNAMFLHLKKHIATLRVRQEGNKFPYKISTGVRFSSYPAGTGPLPQAKVNGHSTMTGGVKSKTPVRPIILNRGTAQNAQSTSLNKHTFMKVLPINKAQINPSVGNRTNPITQVPAAARTAVPPLPIVNQAAKTPVILNPQNLPIQGSGANGQQMLVQMGKQLKVVQGAGSTAGSSASSNMTFVLMPVTKPAQAVKGSTPGNVRGTPSVHNRSVNLPKILQTSSNQPRMVLHKASVVASNAPRNSSASPLDITNEMILKAKAVLDRRTANQIKASSVQGGDCDGISPSFTLKITPPRLYDLAKHAVMTSDANNLKLLELVSRMYSRKPISKTEIKLKIFPRGALNPGTGNSSFGIYMERKNEFLSSQLQLERVGSQNLKERCKRRHTRTRVKKLKNRFMKTADPHKLLHLSRYDNLLSHPECITNEMLHKKRTRKSVLWWKEPEPKRIRYEALNRKTKVKFKQIRKPQSFWYDTPEDDKKASRKRNADKPLKEILQCGLIVLKRNATTLPHRESVSGVTKKIKKCDEVTIGGKVIKIKQEPMSDEESVKKPLDMDDVPDEFLQPPSDDDMDDLFPEDNAPSDIDTTDSESEFCIAKRKAQKMGSPAVRAETSEPKQESVKDEVDVPLLAIKYFQRVCAIIRIIRENTASDQLVCLPATLKYCKICSVEFERVDLLLQHYKDHAGELQKKDHGYEFSTRSTELQPNKVNRKHGFKKCDDTLHSQKPFECELCHVRFYTCKTFEEHLIERHSHSTKAMARVLFSRSNKSENTPTTNHSSLNDLLIENAYQYASDSLECYSPPLPSSPKVGAAFQRTTDSLQLLAQTVPAAESTSPRNVHSEPAAPPDLQPIKLTLFPRNGSGLSRICFANNRKLLES